MSWMPNWSNRDRRLVRTADGKLAPAPEQKATKLAETEEFKPAPLAMNTNLPVPVDPKTGKPKPEQQASAPTPQPVVPPAPASTISKAPPTAQLAPAQSTSKPVPMAKSKTLWASLLPWGKSAEEELEEDLAANAEKQLGVGAKPAPKKYYEQPAPKPDVKPTAVTTEKFEPAPVAMSKGQVVPAVQSKPAPQPAAVSAPSKKTAASRGLFSWLKTEEELEEEKEIQNDTGWANSYKAEIKPKAKVEEKPKEAAKPKLAEAEKFKPAPIAMSTNPPAPVAKPVAATSAQTGIVPGIFNAFKKKEKPEDDLEEDLEEELKKKQGWENKVKEAKVKEAEEAKAKETKKAKDEAEAKKAEEAEKNKPIDAAKLPTHKKPTFEEYRANPSRFGKAPGVSSTYSPTKADLAAQPFKPFNSSCTGWGYKAAENCKNCRAMDDSVHCPCKCGSHSAIDPYYDPFAGQSSPSFQGGKPSTRAW